MPEHPEFFERWAKSSKARRSQGDPVLDIAYGDSAREILDIFPPGTSEGLAPVHIFLHGGYWQGLSKDWFSFMAEAFNRRGECAVIVNYDLCPSVTIGQIVEQIQVAIGWVVKKYRALWRQ